MEKSRTAFAQPSSDEGRIAAALEGIEKHLSTLAEDTKANSDLLIEVDKKAKIVHEDLDYLIKQQLIVIDSSCDLNIKDNRKKHNDLEKYISESVKYFLDTHNCLPDTISLVSEKLTHSHKILKVSQPLHYI